MSRLLLPSFGREIEKRVSYEEIVNDHHTMVPMKDNMRQYWHTQAKKYRRRRDVKIICAIGPATQSEEILGDMIDAGMNTARLNFSHGTHEFHATSISNLRKALVKRPGKTCAILMDTKGPEIRSGNLINGKYKNKLIPFKKGMIVKITSDENYTGDDTCISCTYKKLPMMVKTGSRILIADSLLSCVVISKNDSNQPHPYIIVEIENDGDLGASKSMYIQGVQILLPGISDTDKYDIVNFVEKHNVDIISASFTRTAQSIRDIKKLCPKNVCTHVFLNKNNKIKGTNFSNHIGPRPCKN